MPVGPPTAKKTIADRRVELDQRQAAVWKSLEEKSSHKATTRSEDVVMAEYGTAIKPEEMKWPHPGEHINLLSDDEDEAPGLGESASKRKNRSEEARAKARLDALTDE